LKATNYNNYGREAAAFLKATNNNNYGREAAAFLKNKIMGLFWTIGNHKSQAPLQFLNFATIGNNNYGREAAAFLKATNYNNYGCEAAAFLKATNNKNYGREAAAFLKNKIMGLFWTIGNHQSQLGPRSGRFLKFCINWEQHLRPRNGRFI
jgi:hypothetical protein